MYGLCVLRFLLKGECNAMIKCPHCGRKAEHYATDFSTFISEDEVEVVREYTCVECDKTFYTQDCYNKQAIH